MTAQGKSTPDTAVLTHLESMDDEAAWQDLDLDRT